MSSFSVQLGWWRKRVVETALLPRQFLLMCAGHIICALIIVRPRGPVLGDGMMERVDRYVLELMLQWDWRTFGFSPSSHTCRLLMALLL